MKSIKKSPIIVGLLSLVALFAFAKQEKVIQIFRNGEVIQEYSVDEIDYIEVNDFIQAPTDVNATVSNDQITIKWDVVEGATYNVYRSPDNVNFTLLASKLTKNTYTDTKPLPGSNYYRIKAVVDGKESNYTEAIAATLPDNGMESGIYVGLLGFNNALYEYPITLLDENSINEMLEFIQELEQDDMTLLYYSVEQALKKMQSTVFPSDLEEVALVTFTDGLDRGSQGKTDAYYDSEDGDLDYRNDLNKMITSQTIAGKAINAYSIGLKGSDVVDNTTFEDNLRKLASEPANAFKVTNMQEVNSKFKDIAEELTKRTNIQGFTARIPPEANGSLIRFTFDNISEHAENSKLWIQGVFDLRTKSLTNIEAYGLRFINPVTTVPGTMDEKGNYIYSFEGIVTDNNYLLTSEATLEHIYIKSSSLWQPNKEFGKKNDDFVPKVERSSAAIMLVLDCTTSLDDKFDKAKDNLKDSAKGFIKTLFDADNEEPETPVTPPTYAGDETFTVNGVTFKMISVEGGTYSMGSNTGEDDEKPIHSETVSDFKIGETEVTQGLWKAVMGSNPSKFTGDDNLPVEYVTWNECQTFITKLNSLTGKQFRLPSEAEWEYAARGGNKSKGYTYSGSNTIGDVAWYTSNSSDKTHPVAQKAPNELGIYDMSGNVFEWTADYYSTNYSSARNSSLRVNRGGGWGSTATNCRVALRSGRTPSNRYYYVGLRLAL